MGNSILSNRQSNVPQGQNNAFNPQMIQQFNQFRKTFNGNPHVASGYDDKHTISTVSSNG